MNKEIWKKIEKYEDLYQISNEGRVKNYKSGRILKLSHARGGYKKVTLRGENLLIHRLVLYAFKGVDLNKNVVNHKNSIRDDNRLQNLEWCTQSENIRHMYKSSYRGSAFGRFSKYHNASKPVDQIDINGNLIKTWYCARDVEREIGIGNSNISRCCRGRRKTAGGYIWKYNKKTQ